MNTYTPAPLVRRFFSIIYEALLLSAVSFVALALCIPIVQMLHSTGLISSMIVGLSLLISWWWYFKFSIGRKGQTLPMKVWKIHVIDSQGNRPNNKQLFMRYIWSIIFMVMIPCLVYLISRQQGISAKSALALGAIWWILPWGYALLNPDRQFLYDTLAGTRLAVMPDDMTKKNKKKSK